MRWRVEAAFALLASSACSFPSPEACALACGDEDACPAGFECQAESQRCVPRGLPTSCRVTDSRPNEPGGPASTDAGTGGTGPSGGAGGTTAAGRGGTDGEAGGAAGASSRPAELVLSAAGSPLSACTGDALDLAWRASGGVSPYAWRLAAAPAGVRLEENGGAAVSLVGVPSEPGALIIELEDGAGNTRSAELVVHETPRIETRALPALCGGAAYTALLVAAGGRSDDYVWSAELVGAVGLPDTLEALGLAIDGPTLSGQWLGDAGSRDAFQVTLTVHDGQCGSEPVPIDVDVAPGDSDECPVIHVAPATPDDALPPPCLGSAYSEALSVDGGQPPYRWTALSVPPGLSFDPSSATIDGVAQGKGLLAVELSDAAGRSIQKVFEVAPRDTCWLAYVASEPSPARLELVDARLLERQPDRARRAFPADASESVVDFELSADGRFLAYRLRAEAGTTRLELLRLSDLQTRRIDSDGSVEQFAWSPGAARLAVAFASGAQTLLGGADLSAVDAWQVEPGVALVGLRPLARQPAPPVASRLWPFADGGLAFLSPDVEAGGRRLVTTSSTPSGFAAPALDAAAPHPEDARLSPAASGVFVVDPETGRLSFQASASAGRVSHEQGALLSPTGAFTALARDGSLQIFRAEAAGSGAPPLVTASGCTTLLAWATARDRLACADERGGRNQVVFFDLSGAAGGTLIELPSLREEYVYAAGEHLGRRRAFSPSGRWFAFVSGASLYVARVDGASPRLALTVPSAVLGTPPGALAFSPDEELLLIGAGNSLALLELEQGEASPLSLSASALTDDSCSERFNDASSDWCGAPSRAPSLAWSSDSGHVAFRSSLGTLQLLDVSRARDGRAFAPVSPDGACSEACSSSGSARFQP